MHITLGILSKNARETLIDISKKTKIDQDKVRYRIKNLNNFGVIKGYYTRTNKHRLGLSTYLLLLDVGYNLTNKERILLIKRENIFYMKECIGNWNLLLVFYAEDNKELKDTLDFIKNGFKNNLHNYELLILLERYNFNPFPRGIKV